VRDLDYLLDRDGVVLLVKGDHHPEGRVRAYPVFWPDDSGERQGLGRRYGKETSDCDNERYFRLVPESRPGGEPTQLPELPLGRVERRFEPRQFDCQQLSGRWKRLCQELGSVVGAEQVGVLGSALVGLDNDAEGRRLKDVDFAVYGRAARDALRDSMADLRRALGAEPISDRHRSYHARKFGAPFLSAGNDENTFAETLKRKWLSLQLEPGLLATIRCAYLPGEEPDDLWRLPAAGPGRVEGTVVDDSDVDFMPRRFVVDSGDERTVCASYFWGHQSCVKQGDRVRVKGSRRGDALVICELTHSLALLG
jgi:predicted nucleotidyltransferase